MSRKDGKQGFTLIELLAVVAIIILVMALAMPNFVAMLRGRKWAAAVGNIQGMIWRARALATNLRTDISVEFWPEEDNGTRLWIESEYPLLESLTGEPSVYWSYGFKWGAWIAAGGENVWSGGWLPVWPPDQGRPAEPYPVLYGEDSWLYYGDNARQSPVVWLGNGMTIDLSRSENFVSWDALQSSNCRFGKDPYPDIRIAPNGALIQSVEPTICLKQVGQEQREQLTVVRCTGRLIRSR
ncbi:MAG TPA: prepilin-type N-terminal cleavage/methylation domain-containing protein [Planctomycetota bacterium]|nr:prepilin-type N-terminal cleavage/methylation domain-containing protein [Planctomycetota bacterium]